LAARLVHDFPEVEAATRIMSTNSYTASYEDKVFSEKKVFCVDSNFFQVFSFQLLKGNPATLLKEPNTLVLTQATARKYFGEADPLGKVIYLSNTGNFKVTGIVQDPPHNSHFYFDMLRSMKDIGENDPSGEILAYIRMWC
jgi:putative ABC transport system permease protein